MGKGRAFLYGVLSGIVEPLAAILTMLAAGLILPALPYLLSFAAGAMIPKRPAINDCRNQYSQYAVAHTF